MQKLVKIVDRAYRIFFYIAGALLFAMFVTCAYSVLMRAIGKPSIWADELTRFLMVFMAFMGAPYLVSTKGDLLVDLTEIFAGKNKKLMEINHKIGDIILLVIILYLIYPTMNLSLANLNSKTSALQWNLGYVYMIMPIGFMLCAVAQLKNIIKYDVLKVDRSNRDAFVEEGDA